MSRHVAVAQVQGASRGRAVETRRDRCPRLDRPGHHGADGELPGSESGVAAALLGALWDVPAGDRGGGRRDDGPGVPEHDHPQRGGGRAGADGDGDHHVHGQGVGRAPEPGGQLCLLAARRFSVAAGSRLRHRAADRCVACGAVPARGDQGVGEVRLELSGERILGLAGVPDGGTADAGSRQRDPRDGFGCAEHRHLRCDRRRCLHCAGRSVGEPDLGRVDEPGAHVRPGSRRPRLRQLLGLCRGTARPGAAIAVGFAYVLRGAGGGKSGSGAAQGDLFTDVEKPTQA